MDAGYRQLDAVHPEIPADKTTNAIKKLSGVAPFPERNPPLAQ